MLKYFEQEINTLNILYKEASLEYEKIKHLHSVEIEKVVEMQKREEAKRLDEIASQLFSRNQKGTA
jgi:flagellar biosynthesis chaperone FliJ